MKRQGELLSTWNGWAFVASLALLIGVGLAGVGALLSSTYGAAQVAANASQLHWTNATKGAAGIARAAVAQAVFFSIEGVSDAEGRATAIGEARINLDGVSEFLSAPDTPEDEKSRSLIIAFVEAGEQTIDYAGAGEPALAEKTRLDVFEPAFQDVAAKLGHEQSELALAIADSDRTAGRISRITFVAIAFLIPSVAMVFFWLALRKRLRGREAEMQARLEAERSLNKAKDEFIAGLSHELRTPLTTIVGFSEILTEDPTIHPEAREHLSLISASSADLSRMVNDLLTAARLDAEALSIESQPVNLSEQVEAATLPYLKAGETIHIRVPDIEVYADPLHVRQVVHNLVSNALRHGGKHVMISASTRRGHGTLLVADDGPGVPQELEERLFKRFFHRGRHALVAGSVGLGLAISNELARRMGGVLRYERVDGWTKFTLRLPVVPEADSLERKPLPLALTQNP